jgi:hypothetical protein
VKRRRRMPAETEFSVVRRPRGIGVAETGNSVALSPFKYRHRNPSETAAPSVPAESWGAADAPSGPAVLPWPAGATVKTLTTKAQRHEGFKERNGVVSLCLCGASSSELTHGSETGSSARSHRAVCFHTSCRRSAAWLRDPGSSKMARARAPSIIPPQYAIRNPQSFRLGLPPAWPLTRREPQLPPAGAAPTFTRPSRHAGRGLSARGGDACAAPAGSNVQPRPGGALFRLRIEDCGLRIEDGQGPVRNPQSAIRNPHFFRPRRTRTRAGRGPTPLPRPAPKLHKIFTTKAQRHEVLNERKALCLSAFVVNSGGSPR